jgi:hypothetical protein
LKSQLNQSFQQLFDRLPPHIQRQAVKQYELWRTDPHHPSLQFKQIVPRVWSARVNRQYRVLGRQRADDDIIVWFWIGPHDEYDKLLAGR